LRWHERTDRPIPSRGNRGSNTVPIEKGTETLSASFG
jgi:hypothetical protein